ncbi:MAG: putative toxin-antitoxin system toxin component, PIN family [Terracidiphilus sp.]
MVLDTSVLVAAIRSPGGASRKLLEAALSGQVQILISTALVLEYEAVLTRIEHLRVAELTLGEVEELLDAICRKALEVPIEFQWRPQLRDPDDEMVLEAAINGHAEAIVTFNRAHFASAAKQFGLMVLYPREAIGKAGIL